MRPSRNHEDSPKDPPITQGTKIPAAPDRTLAILDPKTPATGSSVSSPTVVGTAPALSPEQVLDERREDAGAVGAGQHRDTRLGLDLWADRGLGLRLWLVMMLDRRSRGGVHLVLHFVRHTAERLLDRVEESHRCSSWLRYRMHHAPRAERRGAP